MSRHRQSCAHQEMSILFHHICFILLIAVSTYGLRYFDEYSQNYNDPIGVDKCRLQSGTCQKDNLRCAGSYISNKCPGPVNFRCCTTKYIIKDTGFCSEYGVKIISRDSWGARRPKSTNKLTVPVKDFFIHHTATKSCNSNSSCIAIMKDIQNFHMDDRGWVDIAYSFLVGEDGNVYEGRGWEREGAHTKHYNNVSLAASMIGNYKLWIPNEAALKAVKRLIMCGQKKRKLKSSYSLFGHRDVGNTDCPGDALYNNITHWPHFKGHKPMNFG